MVDYSKLRDMYQEKTGYTLFLDFGQVGENLEMHRMKNDIIIPIYGVFRVQPMQLTALSSPTIGVTVATVEMTVPEDKAEEVRKTLNNAAVELNNTAFSVADDTIVGKSYTVTMTAQTCSVGYMNTRGVGMGKVVTITQLLSYAIVAGGVSSSDIIIRIDGHAVPYLQMAKTRVLVSSSATSDGNAGAMPEQTSLGIDLSVPYVDDELGEILRSSNANGGLAIAHCVDVIENGRSASYAMTVGTMAENAQPPLNVGFNISLVQIFDHVAKYPDIYDIYDATDEWFGIDLTTGSERGGSILWGDGSGDVIPEEGAYMRHLYTDGQFNHIVRILKPENNGIWGTVSTGKMIQGATLMLNKSSNLLSSSLPEGDIITFSSGEKIVVIVTGSTKRLYFSLENDRVFAFDHKIGNDYGLYAYEQFPCLPGGYVSSVNSNMHLLYNRYEALEDL